VIAKSTTRLNSEQYGANTSWAISTVVESTAVSEAIAEQRAIPIKFCARGFVCDAGIHGARLGFLHILLVLTFVISGLETLVFPADPFRFISEEIAGGNTT
jgi:hypothetical protein